MQEAGGRSVGDSSWLWAGRHHAVVGQNSAESWSLASKRSTHPTQTFVRKSDDFIECLSKNIIMLYMCRTPVACVSNSIRAVHLFAFNINEYHWLINQPITVDFQYVRRPLSARPPPAHTRTVPLPSATPAARVRACKATGKQQESMKGDVIFVNQLITTHYIAPPCRM